MDSVLDIREIIRLDIAIRPSRANHRFHLVANFHQLVDIDIREIAAAATAAAAAPRFIITKLRIINREEVVLVFIEKRAPNQIINIIKHIGGKFALSTQITPIIIYTVDDSVFVKCTTRQIGEKPVNIRRIINIEYFIITHFGCRIVFGKRARFVIRLCIIFTR